MDRGRKARIEREAAEWVVLIDEPSFAAGDAGRCQAWLAKSEDHRRAFVIAQRAWTGLDQLDKLKAYPQILALLSAPLDERPALGSAASSPDRRRVLAGVGAGAVLAAGAGYAVFATNAAEAYETGIGERRDVVLGDGSHIVLNAATRVEARITASERRARLIRGEALFQIAQRNHAPFVISAASGGIDCTGGEVLVKLLPDGARVSLLSNAGRAWRAGMTGSQAPVALTPMSEVELDGDIRVLASDAALLSRRVLWREGRLAFDNTILGEAVEDVSRQTGVRFVFADAGLRQRRVSGLIDARDLDGFLSMLRQNLSIRTTRGENGQIVLSPD